MARSSDNYITVGYVSPRTLANKARYKATLFSSAARNDIFELECLVDKGVDLTDYNDEGFSALEVAAQYGSLACVRYLAVFADDRIRAAALKLTDDEKVRQVILSHLPVTYLALQEITQLLSDEDEAGAELIQKLQAGKKQKNAIAAFDFIIDTLKNHIRQDKTHFTDVVNLCIDIVKRAKEHEENLIFETEAKRNFAEEVSRWVETYKPQDTAHILKNLKQIVTQEIDQFYEKIRTKSLFGRLYKDNCTTLTADIDFSKASLDDVAKKLFAKFISIKGAKTLRDFIDFLNLHQNDHDTSGKIHYATILGLVLRYTFHTDKDSNSDFNRLKLPDRYRTSSYTGLLTTVVFPALDNQQKYLDNKPKKKVNHGAFV